MVGYAEKQDLRGAEEQRGLDPRRLRRRAAIEQQAEQMTQRAEPAQHGGDQRAGERPVALVERGKFARRVEQFVERAAAAQHAIDHVGGDPPDGEAGHVGSGSLNEPSLSRTLHSGPAQRGARNP